MSSTYVVVDGREQTAVFSLPSFIGLTCLLLVYRLWIIDATPIPIFFDEAYYLSWAQHWQWGYYSKPPVVAWLISLTTSLFGNGTLSVKLASPLLYHVAAVLVYCIALRLFDRRCAFYSGCVFLLMPLVGFNSLFITTDAPLLFFWALSCFAFLNALESRHIYWWLVAGLCAGLGLLSKYTFILLPVTFLIWAAIDNRGQQVLSTPRFWLACTIALLCLLPNLLWNAQHGFVSFQHTAEISHQQRNSFNLLRLLEFWGGQLLVFGPAMALLLLRRLRTGGEFNSSEKWLWSLFVPTFALLSAQALTGRANVNWAAPAYISASIIVGHSVIHWQWHRTFRVGLLINVVLMLVFYHYIALTDALGIERKHGNDPFKRVLGWQALAEQFQDDIDRYPDLPLAGNSRKLLSYFGYYLQPHHFTPHYLDNSPEHIDNHYELLYPVKPGEAYLFITTWNQAKLESHFARVEPIAEKNQRVYSNLVRHARLYRVEGLLTSTQKTAVSTPHQE